MSRIKDFKMTMDELEEPGPEIERRTKVMQIIDFNKSKPAQSKWQSGLFWVDFHLGSQDNWKKAVVSWPHYCQSVAIPLPPDCTTEAEALEYLKKQLIDGLKIENGVFGQ